jgi:predicted DNA-binding protein
MPIKYTTKPDDHMDKFSIRMGAERQAYLNAHCKETGLPMTEVVRRALDQWCERVEEAKRVLKAAGYEVES